MDSSLFDEYYYAHDCGKPYQRNEEWLDFFDRMAARIIAEYQPATVLDAGCAWGFLVEAFRKRGVEAYGIDISEFAIGQVHPDIQPYCRVGAITDPLPRQYDLITCIEVLEHMPRADSERAIENLCAHSEAVIFSSTPFDYKEVTHLNVHDPEYWAEQFARFGFYRDINADVSYITAWAVRFARMKRTNVMLVQDYERKFWQLNKENFDLRQLSTEFQRMIKGQEKAIQEFEKQVSEKEAAVQSLSIQATELAMLKASRAWALAQRIQRLRTDLLPPGSGREKLARSVYRLVRPRRAAGSPDPSGTIASPSGSLNTGSGNHSQPVLASPPFRLEDLPVFLRPSAGRRLNLFVEDLDPANTPPQKLAAFFLACLLSRIWDVDVRIVSDSLPENKDGFIEAVRRNNIAFDRNLEFTAIHPLNPRSELPIGLEDVYITSSWRSAARVLNSIGPGRLIHLVQRDETIHGLPKEQTQAYLEVMRNPQVKCLVQTRALFDHFGETGLDNICQNGTYFEPAWPETTFFPDDSRPDGKLNLFLINMSQSGTMLLQGMEALEGLMDQGGFDPDRWNVYCLSQPDPGKESLRKAWIKRYETLAWSDYIPLVRKTDLGLFLTDASSDLLEHHPFDLAACGVPVATNEARIPSGHPVVFQETEGTAVDGDPLLNMLRAANALAQDAPARAAIWRESTLLRDWDRSFEHVYPFLAEWNS